SFPAVHRAGATPDPIPNSEVKPRFGDGTAGLTRWESSATAGFLETRPRRQQCRRGRRALSPRAPQGRPRPQLPLGPLPHPPPAANPAPPATEPSPDARRRGPHPRLHLPLPSAPGTRVPDRTESSRLERDLAPSRVSDRLKSAVPHSEHSRENPGPSVPGRE